MSVFKRGDVYWYKFRFAGQLIRESSHSSRKQIAIDAERERRRKLELGINGLSSKERPILIRAAAQRWLALKAGKNPLTLQGYKTHVKPVVDHFGDRLVSDVSSEDVTQYQAMRLMAGKAGRTVNYEVACLRGILKMCRRWNVIADGVQKCKERRDVGRAISFDHETKLLAACARSQNPALRPLFVLAIDTGLRASELRSLQRKHLELKWKGQNIVSGELIVPRSKTAAGTGRTVPLTPRVCAELSLWLCRFADACPESYVFPTYKVFVDKDGKLRLWNLKLDCPMGEWKNAWKTACDAAGARYRWHDCRHTFVSRLAENPNTSEQTIKAMAGHVSRQMLERYSHIRTTAKRNAIAELERGRQIAFAELTRKQKRTARAMVN